MERLPGIDLWGSFRKVEREKRDRLEKDFWVLLCPMRAFSFGVYSKICTKYVNCLSITIYMNVLRRWGKVQGDKAASGPCLYSQDLGNCLQSCLGQLDMTEEWILCPVIRIMSLSAPFIPLYHPASCESPSEVIDEKKQNQSPLCGKYCSNYHFLSSWSSVKELKRGKIMVVTEIMSRIAVYHFI